MNTQPPTASATLAAPRRASRSERGAAAAVIVLFTIALMSVAGLVIDGGYALGAQRRAMNAAEQAARAGADQLDQGALRDGEVRVDAGKAQAAALSYLAGAGLHGKVTVSGGTVTVTASTDQDTTLLRIVGINSIPITVTASARSIDEDDVPSSAPRGVTVPTASCLDGRESELGRSEVGVEPERTRLCVC